jgi:hypothetical protein
VTAPEEVVVSPDPARVVLATLAATVFAVVTRVLAGVTAVEVQVPAGPGSEELVDLTVVRIVVVVVVVALAAYVLRLVLDRLAPARSVGVATGVALVALALSAVPVVAADLTTENRVVLGVLHLVVAAPLLRDVVRG